MKTVEFEATVCLLCISISFSLLAYGFTSNADALVFIGAAGGLVSIFLVSHIYSRLKKKEEKQEKQEEERYEELIGEIKGLRGDLKDRQK